MSFRTSETDLKAELSLISESIMVRISHLCLLLEQYTSHIQKFVFFIRGGESLFGMDSNIFGKNSTILVKYIHSTLENRMSQFLGEIALI